ncbi:hypothetical protein [Streptomyces sp. 8L]|uniref:hypothetical protein n=1 Tax=Streptomyces sp. 8L TaxID=2877242 RepID=UPI001CD5059A|nr:hypothetical protein [Streptomyces sp. 8L]MCA1220105.1 hypothetical protein [Streptomyces sp. 8L]
MFHLLEDEDRAVRVPPRDLSQGAVLGGVAHRQVAVVPARRAMLHKAPVQTPGVPEVGFVQCAVLRYAVRVLRGGAVHLKAVEAHLVSRREPCVVPAQPSQQ